MNRTKTGANDLLKIADHLRRQATKAENQVRWREKTFALLNREEWREKTIALSGLDGKDRDRALSLLQVAQVQRGGGAMTEDEALHIIFQSAEWLAQDIITTDPTLVQIHEQTNAIIKREELAEDEYWPVNDPDAPADYRILVDQFDRRCEDIIANILRRYGEDKIVDLFLDDKSNFDRRFEAGRLSFAGRRQQTESSI